jgi:hypothetical protein
VIELVNHPGYTGLIAFEGGDRTRLGERTDRKHYILLDLNGGSNQNLWLPLVSTLSDLLTLNKKQNKAY